MEDVPGRHVRGGGRFLVRRRVRVGGAPAAAADRGHFAGNGAAERQRRLHSAETVVPFAVQRHGRPAAHRPDAHVQHRSVDHLQRLQDLRQSLRSAPRRRRRKRRQGRLGDESPADVVVK